MQQLHSKEFSAVGIVTALAIILIAIGSWWVLHNAIKPAEKSIKITQKNNVQSPTDVSENGKYFVIREWRVRSLIPREFAGNITYQLSDVAPDLGGNDLQSAKIFIRANATGENSCTSTTTGLGDSVDAGMQLIRSEKAKPFDIARYRSTLKENVLSDDKYNYHLNYVTPDCINNTTGLKALQDSMSHLLKI